jgi:thiol-disulfide isomerase/thioredoxin
MKGINMKNSVKRLLALLLTLAMALSVFTSCDSTDEQKDPDSSENGDDNGTNGGNNGTNSGNGGTNSGNGGTEDDETSKIPMGSKVGQRAVTKELELMFGGTVNISQFKGKVVVLNFWGTWCNPCKAELPDFDRLATEYSDTLAVVAVHTAFDAASKAAAPDYVEQNFPNSKIYFAFDKAIGAYDDEYYTLMNGDGSYPTTFVIDERGVITKVKVGTMSYDELKNYIDAALAK